MRGTLGLVTLAAALTASATLVSLTPAVAPTPSAQALSFVNILFDRPGTIPKFGPNEVVEIMAGNINYIGGKTSLPGSTDIYDSCAVEPNGLGLRTNVGIDDSIQPFADLYLVPAGRQPTNNERLVDVNGAPNSVFGGLGGSFLYEPLGLTFPAGNISAGVYAIVVDECQDGYFNTNEDSFIDDAFWVDLDQDVPPLSPAATQFIAMKAQAAKLDTALRTIEEILKIKAIIAKVQEVQSVAQAAVSPQAFASFAIGQAVSAIEVQSGYAAAKARAEDTIKTTITQHLTRYRRLAADPPQADFRRPATPIVAGAFWEESDDSFTEAVGLYAAHHDALSGLSGALLDAIERYQGADQVGDAQWALRHARAIQEIRALYDDAFVGFEAAADLLKAELAAINADSPRFLYFAQSIDRLYASFDSPANLIEPRVEFWPSLQNTGADPAIAETTIADWQRTQTSGATPRLPQHWIDRIDAATVEIGLFADSLAGMDDLAQSLIDPLENTVGTTDTDPTLDISIVGAPGAGQTVTLAVGATPDDVVEWDLDGDGVFDDATGASIAWTVPGRAMVGAPLAVSARLRGPSRETWASALVTVAAGGNRAPVIAHDPNREVIDLAPGATVDLEIDASDPDGDALTYEWFVDGAEQPGAVTDTFTLATPSDRLVGRYVDVLVSDGQARTRTSFFVRTITVDVDLDGFMAFPGPDCLDSQADAPPAPAPFVSAFYVRPGVAELFNEFDDDCNGVVDDVAPGSLLWSFRIPDGPFGFAGDVTEGDVVAIPSVTWAHANRFTGDEYRFTVDWGDGTTEERVVAATSPATATADTTVEFEHRYDDDGFDRVVEVCWEWLDAPPGVEDSRCLIRTIDVYNARPIVNAADLRTWSDSFLAPALPFASTGGWVPLDPDGRKVFSTGNPNNLVAMSSPVPLGPDGYGRAAISHEVLVSGDDDTIGALFGFDPDLDLGPNGEFSSPDADFVAVTWSNDSGSLPQWSAYCNDAPPNNVANDRRDPFNAYRWRGQPIYGEQLYLDTAAFPYDPSDDLGPPAEGPQDPGCDDGPDNGIELLGSVDTAIDPADRVTANGWTKRNREQGAPGVGTVVDPFFVEYDYQPTSITVWVNGVEQVRIDNPDPSRPYPPGHFAIVYGSQGAARVSATAPTPIFQFVQGKGGEFEPRGDDGLAIVPPDGISVPMHDGADDTHEARIDWGDGSATTEGTVTPDPATGHGWFTITDTHAYEEAGEFTGNVCVTDDEGLGSCFPFTAIVANAAPRVEAGPDRAVGRVASLADMTFQDPGAKDTHTATVDWGDGSGAVDVTAGITSTRGGGTVAASHTYATGGTYTLELCVTDQLGGTTCDTRALDVRGQLFPPTIAIDASSEGVDGTTASFGAAFTDRNVDETHTVTVNWGDGSSSGPDPLQVGVGCTDLDPDPASLDPDCLTFGSLRAAHSYTANGTYSVTVTVCDSTDRCDSDSTSFQVSSVAPEPEPEPNIPFLVPLTPARLLETRSGPGLTTTDGQFQGLGTLASGRTLELPITGRGGTPPTGIDAAVINLAAVDPTGKGFAAVYPCGTRPNASSINYTTNDTPNEIIAKLSPQGTICIYAHTTTHLIADIVGYVPTGSEYRSLTPARLLETRSGPGLTTTDGQFQGLGTLASGRTLELPITGRGGTPPTGIDAAVINLAAVDPTGKGFAAVYPCGTRPNASSINYTTNDTPNEIIAKLSPQGTICIYAHTTTHLIADIVGYVTS